MSSKQKIALACDHRGFELKEQVKRFLREKNYEVMDCGSFSPQPVDYPDLIFQAAEKVAHGTCAKAIGICHTGIGSTIAANKVAGVRAALVRTIEEAGLSRAHNDSNMLILGAGFLEASALFPILTTWLETPFEGGRHERRVEKIKSYEQKHCH